MVRAGWEPCNLGSVCTQGLCTSHVLLSWSFAQKLFYHGRGPNFPRCKLFEWAEELAPAPAPATEAPGPSTPATAAADPSVRMCPKCPGGQRQMREAVVNHASLGGNAGRRYFKCDAWELPVGRGCRAARATAYG